MDIHPIGTMKPRLDPHIISTRCEQCAQFRPDIAALCRIKHAMLMARLKGAMAHHGEFRIKAGIPVTGLHFFKFALGHDVQGRCSRTLFRTVFTLRPIAGNCNLHRTPLLTPPTPWPTKQVEIYLPVTCASSAPWVASASHALAHAGSLSSNALRR